MMHQIDKTFHKQKGLAKALNCSNLDSKKRKFLKLYFNFKVIIGHLLALLL